MELGNKIKKHRTARKWSRETLAENAYVSCQTISDWEEGKSYPDIHSLLILGKLFGISPDKLVREDMAAINEEITRSDENTHTVLPWLLTAEYIILIVSPLPLIKYLGWGGAAVWAVIAVISLLTAVKAEKLKKANDLTVYREIKAYMEGRSLEEISADRIKNGSKNGMKVLLTAVSAMIGFTVCILAAWLIR